MTDMQTAVEVLARALADVDTWQLDDGHFDRQARAILAEIAPLIRTTPPDVAELVEALREANEYLHGQRPGLVSGGQRTDAVSTRIEAALAKWEGKA